MSPGSARTSAALLLVVSGLLLTVTLDKGASLPAVPPDPGTVLAPPRLSFERRPGHVALEGVAGSGADEASLQRRAASRFTRAAIETHFRPGVIVPRDWQDTAERLLDVLAVTDSATATIDEHGITLRAVTTDAHALAPKLDALRDVAAVDADVIAVDPDIRLDALCRRNFERAGAGTVTFPLSGTGIGDASLALLDRVVDFAHDCPDFAIVVVGYSDKLGEESWNRHISLARARSVADYIIRAGIPAARIRVEGRGSSEPLADNATPAGRRQNRRVEFDLREASP